MGRGLASIIAAAAVLSGCSGLMRDLDRVTEDVGNVSPTQAYFVVCHGHGCRLQSPTGLDEIEWALVAAYFAGVTTPAEERAAIGPAIGAIERAVGPKTGTGTDRAETFLAMFELRMGDGQMDCVDEMTNTATYLSILRQGGLLRFHEPARQYTNGFFENGFWTHTAASMRETSTGTLYVVDSWWLDNGEPAFVIPAATWQAGWRAWKPQMLEERARQASSR